jgi:asparaginyl-tRNA synthetase
VVLRGGGGSLEKKGFMGRTEVRVVVEKGQEGVGEEVVVCGWARTVRVQGAGSFAFLEINDGSAFQGLVPFPADACRP